MDWTHINRRAARVASVLRSCLAAALSAGLAGAAQAEVYVGVSAGSGGGNNRSENISSAGTTYETVHAVAFSGKSEGTEPAFDKSGSGKLCGSGLGCEFVGVQYLGALIGEGKAAGQASGDGSLKVLADSSKAGSASASAWITDTLIFPTADRLLDITIDIDRLNAAGDGGASMGFELFLGLGGPFAPPGEEGASGSFASFTAFDGEDGRGYTFERTVALGNTIIESGGTIPGSYSFQIDLDAQCTLGGVNLCDAQFGAGNVVLSAGLFAGASGDAVAEVDKSVYLKVSSPYTSLNGYGYLGPPAPVPVPGAVWLLGSGVLALAGFMRRPRR